MSPMRNLVLRLASNSKLQRLVRDKDGVAAVEFAFIVPLMLMLFLGSVEFSQALTIDRRVTQIASSSADLVAQYDKLTNTTLADIMAVTSTLMQPYATAPLKVKILSVKRVNANTPKVVWSYAYGSPAPTLPANDSDYTTMPTGIIDNPAGGGTSSVIVSEATYQYVPIIGQFLTGGIQLDEIFYLRPRKSLCVQNTDVTPSAICG